MNRKYQIGTEENKRFLKDMREGLLSFGRRFPSPGGASYYLGDDGTPWTDLNRETWITCRMAHVYSIGAMLCRAGAVPPAGQMSAAQCGALADANSCDAGAVPPAGQMSAAQCSALADAALRGVCGELADTAHGGWYAGLTKEGQIVPNKQCYAHAFVILAACSGLLAGNEKAAALLADALQVFDTYFWNEKEGLCCDTWDTDFQKLDDYRGLNANMHTVEAFLAVADAAGREEYRVRAGRIIDHVIRWASENQWRIPEHFTKDWQADLECNRDIPDDRFKPYGATPGHGIEWARLITQWALSTFGANAAGSQIETDTANPQANEGSENSTPQTGADAANPDARPYLDAAENLYRRAIADAWNADGAPGIVYTTDWEGKPVIHDRMHWTLAEAINTSAVLYHVTGKACYADNYAEFMSYLDNTVLDHVNGSWFHQLDSQNRLLGTVWPGKSDLYHAFQATLIPCLDPAVSIATAVYKATR